MIYSAANGVGLALVIPCVQSLTADYHPPEMRGRAFGVMFFTSALGGALAVLGRLVALRMLKGSWVHTAWPRK